MKGRKPRPTHLKVVEGNPGRRPLDEREPRPRGDARKPAFLQDRAAEIWAEYAPEMTRLGVLTSVDGHMFAPWCALAAEFEADPAAMNANRIAQMRGLASSFGLDASSRARLAVKADDEQKDPAEAFFA